MTHRLRTSGLRPEVGHEQHKQRKSLCVAPDPGLQPYRKAPLVDGGSPSFLGTTLSLTIASKTCLELLTKSKPMSTSLSVPPQPWVDELLLLRCTLSSPMSGMVVYRICPRGLLVLFPHCYNYPHPSIKLHLKDATDFSVSPQNLYMELPTLKAPEFNNNCIQRLKEVTKFKWGH